MPKPGDVVTFVIRSMLGGMNSVAEDNDLISLDPNSKLGAAFVQAKTEFRNVENWTPINRGAQKKTFGYTVFFDSANPLSDILMETGEYILQEDNSSHIDLE